MVSPPRRGAHGSHVAANLTRLQSTHARFDLARLVEGVRRGRGLRGFDALPRGIGRLEVIEGAGHFPWLDAPDRYWPMIEDFVASPA